MIVVMWCKIMQNIFTKKKNSYLLRNLENTDRRSKVSFTHERVDDEPYSSCSYDDTINALQKKVIDLKMQISLKVSTIFEYHII